MSGRGRGRRSVLVVDAKHEHQSGWHFWRRVSNVVSVISIIFASVTSFLWFGPSAASAAGGQGGPPSSASLSQCTNGAVGPPIDAQPCVGSNAGAISVAIPGINGGASTSYKNWVTGNANGNNAHWAEGDFISYRAAVSGIRTGVHTIVFHYDTVNTGLHAIDYLGSFDGTETASTTPTTVNNGQVVNANNSNPCADLITEAENCNPSAPTSLSPIPAANMVSCGGAPGTFAGTQEPGTIDLFGPSGSAITGVTYLSQNVLSGTGTCTTTVQVSFSVPHNIGADTYVVLAWGGHIASEHDWGAGNGASSVNGSPYHMSLDTLDGSSTGSQDRSLSASAIYFLPTVSTVVYDDGSPATSSVAPGSSVNDTATLTGALSSASGTVQYLLYSNLTCAGETPISNQQVTVTNGVVPPSPAFTPAAGLYSYMAFYSGDSKDLPARSSCEPFAVGTAAPSISTVVNNASTDQPVAGAVPAGASVYDTATINYSGTEVPTGTVTYSFYSGGSCTTGSVVGTPEVVTLSNGTVPNSSVQGPLTSTGSPYAFKASYSGDSNFLPGASDCEPFTVGEGIASLSSKILLSNEQPVEGPVPVGSQVIDTAALEYSGPVPTGSVTYTLFNGASDCVVGRVMISLQVPVQADGSVPHTSLIGPLNTAGPYAFKVVYSGDGNYPSGDTECEPFSVGQELPTVATVPYNASTNQPVTGALPLGSSIYDTATISHYGSLEPTGTVTYTFFKGGADCETGTVVGSYDVQVNPNGTVENSPVQSALTDTEGPYAFSAYYHGDENFIATGSACEPITVTSVVIGGGVVQGVPSISTTVYDAANNLPVGNLASGATVFDTVSISNLSNIDPTGTVTYTFFSGGNCVTGTVVGTPQVVTVGAHGAVPSSSTQGPLSASGGPYAFQATYSGDANYLGDTSDCEPFTVGQASLTVTTSLSATSTEVGIPVYDTAQIVGATSNAGGTVTYAVYSDSACTAFIQNVNTVTVASGQVPNSAQVSFSSPGTYYFQVYYTGDGENTPARSICASEVLTVTPVPVGAAQTGSGPTGGHSSGRTALALLLGGAVALLGSGVLVRRRWMAFGARKQ